MSKRFGRNKKRALLAEINKLSTNNSELTAKNAKLRFDLIAEQQRKDYINPNVGISMQLTPCSTLEYATPYYNTITVKLNPIYLISQKIVSLDALNVIKTRPEILASDIAYELCSELTKGLGEIIKD